MPKVFQLASYAALAGSLLLVLVVTTFMGAGV